MALVKKLLNGTEYYTDDRVFYTFQQVKATTDTLWSFACTALGITKKNGFTSRETKDITDLAGISPHHATKFLLLKNGKAIPVPYRPNGSADLHPDDIILRSTVDPGSPKPVTLPVSAQRAADRLQEIEELHTMKFLTDQEYQDKRAKIVAEL